LLSIKKFTDRGWKGSPKLRSVFDLNYLNANTIAINTIKNKFDESLSVANESNDEKSNLFHITLI
jgi:hypothetical protein